MKFKVIVLLAVGSTLIPADFSVLSWKELVRLCGIALVFGAGYWAARTEQE